MSDALERDRERLCGDWWMRSREWNPTPVEAWTDGWYARARAEAAREPDAADVERVAEAIHAAHLQYERDNPRGAGFPYKTAARAAIAALPAPQRGETKQRDGGASRSADLANASGAGPNAESVRRPEPRATATARRPTSTAEPPSGGGGSLPVKGGGAHPADSRVPDVSAIPVHLHDEHSKPPLAEPAADIRENTGRDGAAGGAQVCPRCGTTTGFRWHKDPSSVPFQTHTFIRCGHPWHDEPRREKGGGDGV